MKRLITVLAVVLASVAVAPVAASASYGLEKFDVTFSGVGGETQAQAGSHPYQMTTSLAVNSETVGAKKFPEGEVKDVEINQIPGFIGDQTIVPQCATTDFLERANGISINNATKCADSTVVGLVRVEVNEGGPLLLTQYAPLYNLTPVPGSASRLGFNVLGTPVTISVGVNEKPPYELVAHSRNISEILEFVSADVTLWGVPADPRHDPLRGNCLASASGTSEGECSAGVPAQPFLTLPRACQGPLNSEYATDSWQDPGTLLSNGAPDLSDPSWVSGFAVTHDEAVPANPQGMVGCARLGFAPSIAAHPTTISASSPTGLDFELDVKDEGLKSAEGVAQSDIKKVVVALPEGVTANPALAEGLAACSETGLAKETINSTAGEGCPEQSKIGSVEVETPLLAKTLKGSLFLATPYANPFGTLLGLYVVIRDPLTGILIKLPGKVTPNETTGQLVSVFDDLPQLPFNHFHLQFREGQRSPLTTPDACGTYTTRGDLTPWADPVNVLHDTATFNITSGIAGDACPPGGIPPFKPGLVAGTQNNNAASYSPMNIQITRNDSEQEITGFSSLLPTGLTANLTGVPFCTEAQIAQANQKSGAEEETNPSCPVASQIGHTLVGVGVGSVLAYNPGKLYMAGPYQGAPFSVAAITAAKVGPFDLGTVIVHLPLNIDPVTARVSIPAGAADQIPHIIKGIVVHVRDIRVYVDRPNFTLNPTNCQALSLTATVYGAGQNTASPTDDQPSTITNRFQAANCANLTFKPIFTAATAGKTNRKNGASLTVKLTYPKEALGKDTNIRSVKVELPKQLPSRLTTLQKACTAHQFETNPAGCPPASRVGQAKAITPILPVPLEGPAYFVSYGGAQFPELVIVLQGYGVTIDLHGETFINEHTNVTSSTFRTVPDQPVQSFELTLPQGPNSALAAPSGLCNTTKTTLTKKKIKSKGRTRTITHKTKTIVPANLTMPTLFTGQNGAVVKQNTQITITGCAKTKAKKTDLRKTRHSHVGH